jgi:hypothetical protein
MASPPAPGPPPPGPAAEAPAGRGAAGTPGRPPAADGDGAGPRPGGPAGLLADLLICENTVVRLPFRYRVLWLALALGGVALLALLGWAGRAWGLTS